MSKNHNLKTTLAVTRSGRSVNVSVKGSLIEAEGQLTLGAIEARNSDSGDVVELTGNEREQAMHLLTVQVQRGWADAARIQLLDLAQKLVDDKYGTSHPTPRDAAIARRSDGNALARMLLALDADIRGGRYPAPAPWLKAPRNRNEVLAQAAPQAFEQLVRMAQTLKTVRGSHFESQATEALGLAARVGYVAPPRARG